MASNSTHRKAFRRGFRGPYSSFLIACLLVLATALAGCTQPDETGDPGDGGGNGNGGGGGNGNGGGGNGEQPAPLPIEQFTLPNGVQGEIVARGLDFPTAVDWDDNGTMYVGEVGFTEAGPRILRIGDDGTGEPVEMTGANLTPQLLDITYHEGEMYFTTTAKVHALNLETGETREVFSGFPAWGDHRTNEIVFRDGRLFVGQGTVTNSGVMGLDQAGVPLAINNVIEERPEYHEVPCTDVTLSGLNFETVNPYVADTNINAAQGAADDAVKVWYNSSDAVPEDAGDTNRERVVTGPYKPFGTPGYKGEVVSGEEMCNGAVFSMTPDGQDLRNEGWGFRNPFGLKFDDEGTLWVADNGYDARGSRPISSNPDKMWHVTPGSGGEAGTWHGFPDYVLGRPISDPFYTPLWGQNPGQVFEQPPNEPPRPWTFFSSHSSSNKFDFAPADSAWAGDVFIAQFGTLNVEVQAGATTGMDVVHVDRETGRATTFIHHQDRYSGEFRPVEAKFGPDGRLYVVAFGEYKVQQGEEGTGGQGETVTSVITPGTGAVYAFTLPDSKDNFQGQPVGNPGGEGDRTVGGEFTDEAPGDAQVVEVFEFGYSNPNLEVAVGDTVAFPNIGVTGHTVTEYNNTFNSGFDHAPGTTWVFTPDEPGEYRYYCIVHPVMQGKITVTE